MYFFHSISFLLLIVFHLFCVTTLWVTHDKALYQYLLLLLFYIASSILYAVHSHVILMSIKCCVLTESIDLRFSMSLVRQHKMRGKPLHTLPESPRNSICVLVTVNRTMTHHSMTSSSYITVTSASAANMTKRKIYFL